MDFIFGIAIMGVGLFAERIRRDLERIPVPSPLDELYE
jgi:hypothetical protein